MIITHNSQEKVQKKKKEKVKKTLLNNTNPLIPPNNNQTIILTLNTRTNTIKSEENPKNKPKHQAMKIRIITKGHKNHK